MIDRLNRDLSLNDSLTESLLALKNTELQSELSEVINILIERLTISEFSMPTVHNNVVDNTPIKMHARFPKEHILVAFGDSTFTKNSSNREGVLTIAEANTDLLFVTLNKCEKRKKQYHSPPPLKINKTA